MRHHVERNVGGNDRVARLLAGTTLLVVGVAGIAVGSADGVTLAVGSIAPVATAAVLLLVGVLLVVTGYRRQCPINSRLGIDTFYSSRI